MRAVQAIVVGGGMSFGSALSVAAPGDLFLLQIPGVTGEVTRPRYPGWIAVNSFSLGVSHGAGDAGADSGTPRCEPLSIVKPLDTTSAELARLAANGDVQPWMTLVALRGTPGEGRFEFLKFTLTGAIVAAVQGGNDAASASPTEQLTLAARQITVTATPKLPDGRTGIPVRTRIERGGPRV